jgi:hypothetical protein
LQGTNTPYYLAIASVKKERSFANNDTREDAANLVRAGDIETLLSADQLRVGSQLFCPQITDIYERLIDGTYCLPCVSH